MALVRYSSRGPLASLRGAIGRLLPDGRAQLRGVARAVPHDELERPRYWCLADGAWSGPFPSYEAARDWLVALLVIWRADVVAQDVATSVANETGGEWFVAGCRVRLVAGGDTRPVA